MINKVSSSYFLEDVSQVTLATVLTILVLGHENTSTTSGVRALTTKTSNLARLINLVHLQDSQLDLGTLVLDLLGSGVSLLLSLLTTTEKFGVEVKSRIILNTIESKSFSILKRLTSKRKTLEISINT
jgi:hypothetical protein